jgi:hypothetical protein
MRYFCMATKKEVKITIIDQAGGTPTVGGGGSKQQSKYGENSDPRP